jgi:hypothetical protein
LSILKIFFSAIFLFIGCAGEDGSPGPTGPTGPSGRTNISLIEVTIKTSDRDTEFSSYYIDDRRINIDSVIGVYIKQFFTNTGDPYYTPFKNWADSQRLTDSLIMQIIQGRIRLFDPDNDLNQEIIVVAILN